MVLYMYVFDETPADDVMVVTDESADLMVRDECGLNNDGD